MSKHTDDGKPSRSILKKSSDEGRQKSFQWDESNILATYHPVDKTYGHMKIEEPKTPFVFDSEDGSTLVSGASFSPEDLAARLAATSNDPEKQLPRSVMLNEVEDEHHKEFREKRKQHYNEFLAVKLAKENLLSDDEDETTMVDEDKEEIDEEIRHNVEQAAINARLNAELSRISRRNNDQSVDDNTSRIHNSLLKHAKP